MTTMTSTILKRTVQAGLGCLALGAVFFAAAPADAQPYYGPPGYYHHYYHRPPPYRAHHPWRHYWRHGRWFYR